jgi:hypothetical protein
MAKRYLTAVIELPEDADGAKAARYSLWWWLEEYR